MSESSIPPALGGPILAIDSSTEQAGLSLFDGAGTSELHWPARRTQTVSLLHQIHHLLDLADLTAGDLGTIAVATGPGTFNGLRVGMSVAKGLVLGLGVPLLGVSTLDAAALPALSLRRSVIPIVAAGRGRIVWAEYEAIAGMPQPTISPRNSAFDDLADHLRRRADEIVVTGEIPADHEATLAAIPGVDLPPPPLRLRRAAAIAWLAWERRRRGESDDPVLVEPVYAGR